VRQAFSGCVSDLTVGVAQQAHKTPCGAYSFHLRETFDRFSTYPRIGVA
jgi:hypothetical protein